MEKQGEPPSYSQEGYGYGGPQAPPSYNQAQTHPQYPPQQPYPQQQFVPQPYPQQPYPQQPYVAGAPPPQQGYTHQQYPNVVVHQPVVAVGPATGMPPPDHMTAAIFATLCCFWPTGIIAIMRASDAKNAWMRGDSNGAHQLARGAKAMVNISIIAGICSIIVCAIIIGVYVGVILQNIDPYDTDKDFYD